MFIERLRRLRLLIFGNSSNGSSSSGSNDDMGALGVGGCVDVDKVYNSGSGGSVSEGGCQDNQKEIVVHNVNSVNRIGHNEVIKNCEGAETMSNNVNNSNNINSASNANGGMVSVGATNGSENSVETNNVSNNDSTSNKNNANALPGLTAEQTVEVLKELHYLETVDSSMAKGLNNPKGWQIILDAKMWNLSGGARADRQNANANTSNAFRQANVTGTGVAQPEADPIVKGGSSGVVSDQLQRLRNGNLSSKEAGDILLKLSQS